MFKLITDTFEMTGDLRYLETKGTKLVFHMKDGTVIETGLGNLSDEDAERIIFGRDIELLDLREEKK